MINNNKYRFRGKTDSKRIIGIKKDNINNKKDKNNINKENFELNLKLLKNNENITISQKETKYLIKTHSDSNLKLEEISKQKNEIKVEKNNKNNKNKIDILERENNKLKKENSD